MRTETPSTPRLPVSPASQPTAPQPTTSEAAPTTAASTLCPETPSDACSFQGRPPERFADLDRALRQATAVLGGNAVTRDERRQAVEVLARLSPQDLRSALDALERSGHLERLVDGAGPELRRDLLETLRRRGVLYVEGGDAPRGPFAPPATPSLLSNTPDLPRSIRSFITDENVERVRRYKSAHADYVTRYMGGVEDAPTISRLRSLGPPAPLELPSHEPGVDFRRDMARVRDFDARTAEPEDAAPYGKLRERFGALTGRPAMFEVWMYAEASGSLAGVGYSNGVTIGDGPTRARGSKVGVQAGPVGMSTDMRGNPSFSIEAGNHAIELGPDGLKTEIGLSENVAVTVAVDGRKAEVENGLKLTKHLEPGGLEVGEVALEAGFGFRLSPADAAMASVTDVWARFFDAPEDLKRGLTWSMLPAERQRFLREELGWSEKEWSDKLPPPVVHLGR